MANAKVKLTVKAVDAARPGVQDVILWDTDVPGLGLKVTPKGIRTFFLFYRTKDHKQRKPAIGRYPAVKPDAAREIAKAWLSEVARGGDPSAERKLARERQGHGTVAELFESYRTDRLTSLTSGAEAERVFRKDIIPALGKRRAEEVGRQEVTRLLDMVKARSLAGAHQVKAQLSAFYEWALPRLPDGAANPVKGTGKLPSIKARDRVLSEVELKALWKTLESEADTWRIGLRLLLLTGQRRSEVFLANWNEFDLVRAEWHIPAARSKNSKTHIVPLTKPVITLLEELASEREGALFAHGKTAASGASRQAARISAKTTAAAGCEVPPWRWHDLRRTVATGMQRLGTRLEVTEAVLNHVSGSRSGIAGVYQRHDYADEKRQALAMWADELTRIVDDALVLAG